MDQDDDSRRAQEDDLEELRRRLNEEIEREGFDLSAKSVMDISVELDQHIVEHYQNNDD